MPQATPGGGEGDEQEACGDAQGGEPIVDDRLYRPPQPRPKSGCAPHHDAQSSVIGPPYVGEMAKAQALGSTYRGR